MRVSIVDNAGNFEKLVDINGGATFCDTGAILDNILEIYENNEDAVTVKKRFLDFARSESEKEVSDCVDGNTLLIYGSGMADTVFYNEFKVVNFEGDETRNLLMNLYREKMLNTCGTDTNVEVTDPRVQVTDNKLTGLIPDKVRVAFKTQEETMQAFKDLMEKGYVDTSNAVFIVTEYYSRRRFNDHYDIRMQAYLVDRK